METDDAAAAAAIRNAIEVVRHRSLYKRSWTIKQAEEDMRSGDWERRRRYYRKLQENACLAEVDPWLVPPYFAMRKEPWTSLQTRSGYWKEKEDELKAIRGSPAESSSLPSYQGVRRTLEFYKHDDTKTDWVTHEYHQVDQVSGSTVFEPAVLILQEDVVLRKVFNRRYTDKAPSDIRPLDILLNVVGEKQVNAAEQSQHGDDDMMAKDLQDAVQTFVPAHLQYADIFELMSMSVPTQTLGLPLKKKKKKKKVGLGGCKEARSGGCWEFPIASGAPDDGESDVWQHFTRINTKDPDVVYAACHRCDRVLKAHSKNGTSSLRRHRKANTCLCNNNPLSTDEDQKILRDLRANLDLYKQGKEGGVDSLELNSNFGMVDPWDLPPRHITSSLSWETHQGRWEEVNNNNKLTAIRIGQLSVPHYVGLKRTLEFHHNNGTKMNWIMFEYYQVDEYVPPTLLLEGNMVFRKVFQIYEELSRMWNRDNDEEECHNGECEEEVKVFMDTLLHDCLLAEGVQGDKPHTGKRKRSEVWLHFTKIYTTDPGRVYAVCHHCDECYMGHSKKDGTSHLKRHNKTCSSKRLKLERMKPSIHVH